MQRSVVSFLEPAYRVWTPDERPMHTELANASANGAVWKTLDIGPPGAHRQQPFMMRRNDYITRAVARNGKRWQDCDALLELWHRAEKENVATDATDLFIDVGANIGLCTLPMLYQTNARVVAVEPSPANLFYLTHTLHRAAAKDDALRRSKGEPPPWAPIRNRVAVLPYAAGKTEATSFLRVPKDNAGNSQLEGTHGQLVRDSGNQQFHESYEIRAAPLGALLTRDATLRVMKLDVQGYECLALSGLASHMLQTGRRLPYLKVEVAERWLLGHGCSSKELLSQLRSMGYNVGDAGQRLPACFVQARVGCDLVASYRGAAPPSSRCKWARHAPNASRPAAGSYHECRPRSHVGHRVDG